MAEHDWILIDEIPPANAQIVYYVPLGRYIYGCGSDYSQVKAEHPACTHWRVVFEAPMSRVQVNAFPRG